ncbi:hypothetical protein A9Q96_14575 [Rhodobacterales bacterium 52_120_T64]|nr:hypothetical protein A9Q96_14575 [Rhodobacterales bacterium 52_120_T64]
MDIASTALPAKHNGIERRGLMDALDASQSLIWFNGAGVVVDANKNALRLFAYGESDILKQDYFALCGAKSKQILADKREWARITAGDMCHTERSYSAQDGREVWSSVNFAALKNDDRSIRRVLAMFTDMGRFAWKPNETRWAGY